MNKREKELIQLQLKAEEDVIKELENQYKQSLKDINEKVRLFESDIQMLDEAINTSGMDEAAQAMLQSQRRSKVYQKQFQEALQGQIGGILDRMQGNNYSTIESYLKDCYEDAFIGTMYQIHGQGIPIVMPIDQAAAVKAIMTDSKLSKSLYESIGVDVKGLKKSIRQEITRGISSGLSYSDIARNIANKANTPLSRAKTIVRTEGHRIQQQSTDDARKGAISRGCDVVKQWDATLDGKTRRNHRLLDGQIREEDEPFEVAGKKVKYPGGFGDPAEDCNCRCVALTRARWALDEDELKTLQERAEYFGLDKTKDFEDYKNKYLKAEKESTKFATTNIVKAGKVEANGRFVNNKEKLYRYAEKIKPIEGYDDFTCHADPDMFYIDMVGDGNEDDYIELSIKEFAAAIRNSKSFTGGNIRIISCQAGAKPDGAAKKLADELQVAVYAPTEIVNIDENGEMFLSDNDILAEMWYHADKEDRAKMKETGKWIEFKPGKG